MLSRVCNLRKFNTFILRQLSYNSTLSKEESITAEKQKNNNNNNKTEEINKTDQTATSTGENKTKQETENVENKYSYDKYYYKKKFPNKNKDNTRNLNINKDNKNLNIKDINKNYINKNNNYINNKNTLNKHELLKAKEQALLSSSSTNKDIYNNIIQSFKENQNSFESLILPCQQLIDLADPAQSEQFNSDPLRNPVLHTLSNNLINMKPDELFTSSQFILKFEPKKLTQSISVLDKNAANFKVDQLLKLSHLLRTNLYTDSSLDTIRNFLNHIRDRLDEIQDWSILKIAFRLFSQEETSLKFLDNKLIKLAETFKFNDWIDILNTKSILRQRNIAVLELCGFNLMKNKDKFDINSIQKCLLSCGILNFNDSHFYKFLLDTLNDELSKNLSNKNWSIQNENNLASIINSIGILQLRDENLLKNIASLLKLEFSNINLIIKFIISCANLNYDLPKETMNEFMKKITTKNFNNLKEKKDQINYLNFVWSLCYLKWHDKNFTSQVLNENFWKNLLKDVNSPETKSILLKLLNINLYSQILIENYDGSILPENFNIQEYAKLLIPKTTTYNSNFISALSSYKSIDKYVKLNLLTPFGILIDALMLVDKKGNPIELSKYFSNESTLETTDNEIKIAFKLVGYKEQTLIDKKVTGRINFQIKLLKELGYIPIVITQEELQSSSLHERVKLISDKIKASLT